MKLLRNILFLILLLTLCSCKKYPEDKFISFTTVKMRLQGEWQLEKIEVNGENIGYKYNDSLAPLIFKDFKFWFVFDWKFNSTSNETHNLFVINKSSKDKSKAIENVDVSGVEFSIFPKRDKKLKIASVNNYIPINDFKSSKILLYLLSDYLWQIRELYNKELIIEKTKNDLKYRLSFKKIRNN